MKTQFRIFCTSLFLLFISSSVMGETLATFTTFNHTITEVNNTTSFIGRGNFDSAQPGDYLWFNVSTKDNFSIRLGNWDGVTYPGCYLLNNVTRGYDEVYRIYLTEDLLAAIKEKDLRVYGHGTLTEIKLDRDGIKRDSLRYRKDRGEKTLWTGYYWMNEWTTLELYPEAFNDIDLSQYKSIRFYHEAKRTGYFIKVAKNLSSDIIADNDAITHYDKYAELELTDDIRSQLTSGWGVNRFNVQMNKESGAAFNFTDVVLIPKDPVDPCSNCFTVTIH